MTEHYNNAWGTFISRITCLILPSPHGVKINLVYLGIAQHILSFDWNPHLELFIVTEANLRDRGSIIVGSGNNAHSVTDVFTARVISELALVGHGFVGNSKELADVLKALLKEIGIYN